MNTDTQNTNEPSRTDPQLNRRQLIKTVGAGAGVAAVGSGAVQPQLPHVGNLSFTGYSEAAVPVAAYAISVAGAMAGGYVVGETLDLFGSDADVDENLNTETYVYQISNTIASQRNGPDGGRTEMSNDFANANTGHSAYAEAAGDAVVTAAAMAVLEGESDQAQNRAYEALDRQTTRSIINVVESHNAGVLRLFESGALVEDYEQQTGTLKIGNYSGHGYTGNVEPYAVSEVDSISEIEPMEDQEIDTSANDGLKEGYAGFKVQLPSEDLPVDPTSLDGRDEPLTVYMAAFDDPQTSDNATLLAPSGGSNGWFSRLNNFDGRLASSKEMRTHASDYDQITVLNTELHGNVLYQISQEYDQMLNDLPDVVDQTVNGLEQGSIEPTDVFDASDLLTDFDPLNDRGQFAREMMSIGAEMPGEPQLEVKVSHPDLEADSLWGDLYLRLADGIDLDVNGPMTIPSSDYELAWLGYTGQVSGEYQTQTLAAGSGDLEILEVNAADQIEQEPDDYTVEEGGAVPVAPAETDATPEPLAEPDPEYDDWGVSVTTSDGSTGNSTVGDAYVKDGKWYVDTELTEGLAVESVRFTKPSTYQNTSIWTPGATDYNYETAEETILRRRELNEAIEEQFSGGVVGGGGFFDGGIPTLPGLGVIESAVVVFLAIAGLNAASG
jgi:hypothetical protein